MYYPMTEWKLLKFEVSDNPKKKYQAIISNGLHTKKVPFGAMGYQQFRDKIGLYTVYDHKDEARRDRYRARHMGTIREGFFSPGYFSMAYLW
jgi:hypothetical protein